MAVGDRLGVHRQMRVVELFGLLLSVVCWRDLARLSGVDRSTITRWVHGTSAVSHSVIRMLELSRELKDMASIIRVRWRLPPGLGLEDQP